MTSNHDLEAHNFKDLEGRKFGRWTVLRRSWQPRVVDGKTLFGTNSTRAVRWICQCECGVIREVGGEKLRQEKSKSCGCLNAKDMSGRKVGPWKVTKVARDHEGKLKWLCRCGNIWALFDRLTLTAKTPPPSFDELEPRKARGPVKGATYGTWQPVGASGVTLKDDNTEWVVAEGAGEGTLCECRESGWLVVFPDDMLDPDNPPPTPADWKRPQPFRGTDHTGETFGNWKVVGRAGSTSHRVALWNCECTKCGLQRQIPSTNLKTASQCKCPGRETDGQEAEATAGRKKRS